MNVNKWMKSLLLDVTMLLLGVTLTFAFAPYNLYPIAVVIPAILLAFWLKMNAKSAFLAGFLFGIGFYGSGVYWVYISVHEFGDVNTPLAFIITGGMIAILSMYPALTGYCLNRYFPVNNTTKITCAFPALWVLFEWARSLLLSGFAWLLIGYSQTHSPLRGYAPILSVYGVSLAVVLTSALFINAIAKLKQKIYFQSFIQCLIILAIWVAGGLFSLIPWTRSNHNPIPIALVQGAIPQQLKWSSENLELSLKRYDELTEPLWGKYQIIVWPETAVPMTIQDAAPYINTMDKRARSSHTTLILGIPIYVPAKNGYRNAIISLGDYPNIYSKRHLVPFGEYVPFANWLFPILNFMNIPTSDVIPGERNQGPLILGGDLKISPSICYEISFPELIHTYDKSIGFLLTITNDAWFGHSSAQAQHLQIAEMRALELQRPVVMVSNDGITAIIGPNGKIISAAAPYQATVLEGQVDVRQGLTPWMKNGMDPVLFILLVLLIPAIVKNRAALRRANEKVNVAIEN